MHKPETFSNDFHDIKICISLVRLQLLSLEMSLQDRIMSEYKIRYILEKLFYSQSHRRDLNYSFQVSYFLRNLFTF